LTVGKTVAAFRKALPFATAYVYDNNSTDRTVHVAPAVGAVVRNEPRQGKGNVVRRMFAHIDADIFVLADGYATYEAQVAPRMVRRAIEENLDFVNGARIPKHRSLSKRPSLRQLRLDLTGAKYLREAVHRYVIGLQGFFSPLRQILSGNVERFRN
jgi:hypothetical protein